MLKDLRLALELAGACEQPVPMAAAATPMYSRVAASRCGSDSGRDLGDDRQLQGQPEGQPPDFSAIYRLCYGGRNAQ
eukprot:362121-Chlamydomonas_euryale.AAC.4